MFLEPCSSYIPGCPAPPKGQPPVPSPTKCWKLPSPLPLPFVIDGGLDGSWPRGGIANVTLLGEEATPGGRLGFSTCICVDPLTPFRPVCSRSNGLEVGWSSRALTHPKTGKQKQENKNLTPLLWPSVSFGCLSGTGPRGLSITGLPTGCLKASPHVATIAVTYGDSSF